METRVGYTQVGENTADLLMADVVPLVPHRLPTDSTAICLPNPVIRTAGLIGTQNQKQHYKPYVSK